MYCPCLVVYTRITTYIYPGSAEKGSAGWLYSRRGLVLGFFFLNRLKNLESVDLNVDTTLICFIFRYSAETP